jgi:hypothetical protein
MGSVDSISLDPSSQASPVLNPGGGATGNTPDLKQKQGGLVNKRRAITDASQAMDVINTMEYDAKKLISKAAKISSKLTGEPPYKPALLKAQGKDYFSNISVRFLETIVNRIVPRLYMRLKAVPVLTMASLPESVPDAAKKTEHARRAVTDGIRSWKNWNFFIQGIFREPVVYGYGFATWFDPQEWRPHVIRCDRGFVPFGTSVGVDDIAHYSVRWDYQPHQLVELISDVEQAKEAGWNMQAVIDAVKAAHPTMAQSSWDKLREYDDVIRQSSAWLSWQKGTNLIETKHLFSREADGRVSHRILHVGTGAELYVHEDRYENMAQCTIPFVFEYGNGNIHGSFGIGQRIYDVASQYEKAFNRLNDSVRARSRLNLLVPDSANVNTVKVRVTDDMNIVTGRDVTVAQGATPAVVDDYERLLSAFRQVIEEIVGAYMPPLGDQQKVSATAVSVSALRQEEIYQSVLDNLLTQFSWMIHEMTRRMLSDLETDDPIAKEVIARLREVLSDEEIALFANAKPSHVSVDVSDQQQKNAEHINFLQSKVGDPQFDQRAIKQIQSTLAVGKETTDRILLPDEDPTIEAEQSRWQLLENQMIAAGQQMPVSTRDNDEIHIKILQAQMEQWLQEGNAQASRLGLVHLAAHYESGVQKRTIGEPNINNLKGYISDYENRLMPLEQQAQNLQAQTMASVQQVAQQAPEGMLPFNPQGIPQ